FHKLVGSTSEQDETRLSQLFYCELVEFMIDIVPRQITVESFKIAVEAQRHEQVNVSRSKHHLRCLPASLASSISWRADFPETPTLSLMRRSILSRASVSRLERLRYNHIASFTKSLRFSRPRRRTIASIRFNSSDPILVATVTSV